MKMTSMAAAALFAVLSAGLHAAPAGKILAVAGDATLARAGRQMPLQAGALVESGDILEVGDRSSLQVRFTDESVVALRANSQFRIEDYKFDKSADSDRSILGLLKGGMRTITGLIGKANQKNYAVRTSTATIGIRGTHFSVVSCNNDCRNPDGTQGANGTFGAVTDGRITVSNESGQREFGQQDFFHVPTAASAPVRLLAPPAILNDRSPGTRGRSPTGEAPGSATGSAQARDGDGTNTRTSTSPQLTEQTAPVTQLISPVTRVSSTDLPSVVYSGGSSSGITVLETRLGNNSTAIEANARNYSVLELRNEVSEVSGALFNNAASLASAFRSIRAVGGNDAAGVYWMYESPNAGSAANRQLGSHHAWGDTPKVQLPGAGTAQYNFVGGTTPTDNFGRSGTFSGGNLLMNFGARTVTTPTMSLTFTTQGSVGAVTYTLSSAVLPMGGGPHSVTTTTTSCLPSACAGTPTGSFNGRFVGATLQGYAAAITAGTTALGSGQANTAGLVAGFARQ
jgi:hypothetical protein